MDSIKSFIENVKLEKGRLLGSAFNQSISPKVSEKLEDLKVEIVHRLFNLKKKSSNRLNEDILIDLQNIVSDNQPGKTTLSNGEVLDLDVLTANALLTVINALNDENKVKILQKIGENSAEFLKFVNFSWKQVE